MRNCFEQLISFQNFTAVHCGRGGDRLWLVDHRISSSLSIFFFPRSTPSIYRYHYLLDLLALPFYPFPNSKWWITQFEEAYESNWGKVYMNTRNHKISLFTLTKYLSTLLTFPMPSSFGLGEGGEVGEVVLQRILPSAALIDVYKIRYFLLPPSCSRILLCSRPATCLVVWTTFTWVLSCSGISSCLKLHYQSTTHRSLAGPTGTFRSPQISRPFLVQFTSGAWYTIVPYLLALCSNTSFFPLKKKNLSDTAHGVDISSIILIRVVFHSYTSSTWPEKVLSSIWTAVLLFQVFQINWWEVGVGTNSSTSTFHSEFETPCSKA